MNVELKQFPVENIRLSLCEVSFEENRYRLDILFDDVVFENMAGVEDVAEFNVVFEFDPGFKSDEHIENPILLLANNWKLLGRTPELLQENVPFIYTGYMYPVLLHRCDIGEVKENKVFLDLELFLNFEDGFPWFKDAYFPVKGWFEFKVPLVSSLI
jgi:hypothetical protein